MHWAFASFVWMLPSGGALGHLCDNIEIFMRYWEIVNTSKISQNSEVNFSTINEAKLTSEFCVNKASCWALYHCVFPKYSSTTYKIYFSILKRDQCFEFILSVDKLWKLSVIYFTFCLYMRLISALYAATLWHIIILPSVTISVFHACPSGRIKPKLHFLLTTNRNENTHIFMYIYVLPELNSNPSFHPYFSYLILKYLRIMLKS